MENEKHKLTEEIRDVHLQYLFMCEVMKSTNQAVAQVNGMLHKNKFNVEALSAKEKLTHDQKLITPIVTELGHKLVLDMQRRYGIEFKFINQLEGKTPRVVDLKP